jgi:hypothetical protein
VDGQLDLGFQTNEASVNRPEAERAAVARLRRPRELWGRRSVAIGLVLVWIALTGGVVVLITSSR